MKKRSSNLISYAGMCIAMFLVLASEPTTLKDAFKGHFLVGVAVNRTIPTQTAVKADNVDRTMEQVLADTATAEKHFNQVVAENDTKWLLIHPNPGPDGYDFEPADKFVEFGMRNKMYIAGHTLVWHGQTPGWVFMSEEAIANLPAAGQEQQAQGPGGRRGGFDGPRATREELLARMREHIHTVVGRYKGKIKVWDVVNEALADGGPDVLRNSQWRSIIGDDFIAKAFQYAHEADPKAVLRYNDYGLENPGKREKLKKLVKELQDQNIPIHAIGTQTHISVSTTFETMDETLADLASIGLPIHITELDVNASVRGQNTTSGDIATAAERASGGVVTEAEKRQADAYVNLFRAIMKHKDSVEMVTFWGVNDAVSWLGRGRPLLFDGDNQPKYAFEALMKFAAEYKETK